MAGRNIEMIQARMKKENPAYDSRVTKLQSALDEQNKMLQQLQSKSTNVNIDMKPMMAMLEKQNQMIMRLLSTKQAAPVVTVNNDKCGYKFEIHRDNRGRVSEMMAYPVNSEGKY